MKEVNIIIYRHAQGHHNVPPCNYYIFDPSLTALGHEQARKEHLAREGKKTDIVLSSVSTRAIQTAQGIFPNNKIYATQLLVEYNTGIPCNNVLSSNDLRVAFPTVDFDMFYSHIPLNIEKTYEDGNRRARLVKNLIYGLASTGAYDTIAMVSHSNFIYNLMTVFEQPQLNSEIANARCIEFSIRV